MGKGRKSKREMNRLIRTIKRNRLLKKTGKKTFSKTEEEASSSASEE
jgi:hypothetical protein